MSALIIVEHDNKVMKPSISHVLSAAKQLDEAIILLVVGHDCEAVASQVATLDGVNTVWLVQHECFAAQLAENVSRLVVELSSSVTSIWMAANTHGKNILPRVAALLDVAQISDVVRIIDHSTFEHPIYAGNALETVRVLDEKKVLSVRTTAFEAIKTTQAPCPIERLDIIYPQQKTRWVEQRLSESVRPDLATAKIIVSGGRGLQSAEQFQLMEELADVLGAAVGASRAAVDAGFVPNDYQIGQTGKIVAPVLYIAVGISGAVQHLAGMKDSKVIVAINKDEEAPIFKIADYGLVGDLFVLVPELIQELKKTL
jgi:electron transfer flavoprotein alpha subunit